MRDHTVIVGYGTKGRSAAKTLTGHGVPAQRIVVVDPDPKAVESAVAAGFAGVIGDATRNDVLLRAEIQRAKELIIAAQRDDTAVLVALTARQLSKRINIVASVREEENAAAAAPVRRGRGRDQFRGGGPPARDVDAQPERGRGDGGADLLRQRAGPDRAPRHQGGGRAEPARGRSTWWWSSSVVTGCLDHDNPEASPLQLTDRLIVVHRTSQGDASHVPQGRLPAGAGSVGTMHAITIPEPGGPDALVWAEVPDPVPAEGEVLVEVAATAVNRADLLQRQGFYDPPPGASALPRAWSARGRIAALGAGVTGWSRRRRGLRAARGRRLRGEGRRPRRAAAAGARGRRPGRRPRRCPRWPARSGPTSS